MTNDAVPSSPLLAPLIWTEMFALPPKVTEVDGAEMPTEIESASAVGGRGIRRRARTSSPTVRALLIALVLNISADIPYAFPTLILKERIARRIV